ncbi:hypothetical protein AMS68_005612 [Peltaster fructicola]|uniref:Methyltransferase domain-containing protein n=1 Tax=Peltaster fructicola TaxID=286661 RepID=A0A6H0XZK1_9PEZI|nr:hypothetical protein AMS68_005612 [Peltaster fructicola]
MYKIKTDSHEIVPSPFNAMVNYFNKRNAAVHAAHLLPYLRPDFRLLDVGCGGGSITLDLARILKNGHTIGLDVERNLISVAQELSTSTDAKNVEFDVGNVHDLSRFGDETFDVVHAHQVTLHLENPVGAIKEMRRVLKTGGILALRDNSSMIVTPTIPALDHYMLKFRDWHRSLGKHPGGGLQHHLWAHQAGFSWDKITMDSDAWEESGQQSRSDWVLGAGRGWNGTALKAGVITEEENAEWTAAWKEWEDAADGRLMALDSTLICIK